MRVGPSYRVDSSSTETALGYLSLARQYEGEKRDAQALDAYRNAAKVAPADAAVQNAFGLALAGSGQFAPAVAALRRAVALAPERAPLLNNLGYALLLEGRAEDARGLFRLTLAIDPTHEAAAVNLAFVDAKQDAAAAKSPPPAAAVVSADLPARAPTETAAPQVQQIGVVVAELDTASQAAGVAARTLVPKLTDDSPSKAAVAVLAVTKDAVPVRLQGISIEIINGNGIHGAAARMRLWLGEQGIVTRRLANLLPFSSLHTQVQYRPGRSEAAHEVAQRMPIGAAVVPAPAGSTRADLRVLLGADVRDRAGCETLAVCRASNRLASTVSPVDPT